MRKIDIVLAILPVGNNVREWKDYSEKDWLQSILLMSETLGHVYDGRPSKLDGSFAFKADT